MRKSFLKLILGVLVGGFALGLPAQAADVFVNADITTSTTWTADNDYILTQVIYVTNGATLTIEPGTVINEIMSHEDWLPTFLAAAGDPDIKEDLLDGHRAGRRSYRVHLDGYNFMPFFRGEVDEGPRREIFYFDDNANLNAVRVNQWKIHFAVQEGNLQDSFRREVNMPYVISLRQDPFERAMRESKMYFRWYADKMWTFVPAQSVVADFIATFADYPPSQRSGTFGPSQALDKLSSPGRGG